MEHTTILNRAAREAFRPLGLVQRGRSRTWLADHGCWLIIVELQPSGWGKGSYLNVGAMWLTYPYSHLAFHDGYRQHDFEPFRGSGQFEEAAAALCATAAARVAAFRADIRTATDAHRRQEVLLTQERSHVGPLGPWNLYHTAAFAFASGHTERARELAAELLAYPAAFEWQSQLLQVARSTFTAADPITVLKSHIATARALLKLPPLESLATFAA